MKGTPGAKAPIAILTLASFIALLSALGTALAFPTSSAVYPSGGGCTARTQADASYAGLGEQVDVSTWDLNACASIVRAKAFTMSNSFSLACTGFDTDDWFAYSQLSQADYYYAYGLGDVNWGTTLSTLSVHP